MTEAPTDKQSAAPARRSLGRRMLRWALVAAGALSVLFATAAGALYYNQWYLIYVPKKDQPKLPATVMSRTRPLEYTTSAGRQKCFLVRPTAAGESKSFPSVIWFFFHGQFSTSLDMAAFAASIPDPEAAAVLVEYPGCADSKGRSNGRAIMESLAAAMTEARKTLAADAGTSDGASRPLKTRIFAYSLGTGPGLMYALEQPDVDRIVLGAPFTSLRDMAHHRMGMAAILLSEDYSNMEALRKLVARSPKPAITLISGTKDDIIPHSHSLSLAGVDREWIHHVPIEGANHISIWDIGLQQMRDSIK